MPFVGDLHGGRLEPATSEISRPLKHKARECRTGYDTREDITAITLKKTNDLPPAVPMSRL